MMLPGSAKTAASTPTPHAGQSRHWPPSDAISALEIRPCILESWPGYRIDYRLPNGVTRCRILVDNPHGGEHVVAASLDGQPVPVTGGRARVALPEAGGDYLIKVVLG